MSNDPQHEGERASNGAHREPIAVSETVLSAHLGEESVLLCTASRRYFQLNATGQHIWLGLEQGLDRGALVDSLIETFEVEPSTARRELDRMLDELRAHGLVNGRERTSGAP